MCSGSVVIEEGLHSRSVKPDDKSHPIIVEHLDDAVLAHEHQNGEQLTLIA